VRDGAVFVVENGKAVAAASPSRRVPARTSKSRGLIGGEDLIVSPPQSLHDGERVRLEESKS
jgi:hypothetical protein